VMEREREGKREKERIEGKRERERERERALTVSCQRRGLCKSRNHLQHANLHADEQRLHAVATREGDGGFYASRV